VPPAEPYRLDLRPRARRQLSGATPRALPLGVALAAVEFIDGPLRTDPHRVGKPLEDRHKGQRAARCGAHRIRYLIDEAAHTVIVVDVSRRADTYGTD
jgi:mRNA interferase RelE/StbE